MYCANEGRPLSVAGVGALLSSHLSSKRGVEIGRFGLGFKSVLGITTRPESLQPIGLAPVRPRGGGTPHPRSRPRGRTGHRSSGSLSRWMPKSRRPKIRFLAELMTWATTVVRLPRDTADSSWLGDDLERFPSQFLLFSPHVEQLVLDNQEKHKRRTISATRAGDEVVLEDDGESRWRVFALEHSPSEAAKLDAGAMADRDRIPLVWAVPTRSTGRRGEFWAFFPTLDQTTLNGVVNAPWKLNEDRTRIIEGPFNAELIERLSGLVVENLSALCSADDPGVLLDLMPARGREAAGWADAQLTNHVNELAKVSRSLPDQEGALRFPRELAIHPENYPDRRLFSGPSSPRGRWTGCTLRSRRVSGGLASRCTLDGKPRASLREWLEALMSDVDPVVGCVSALRVASSLARIEPKFLDACPEGADLSRRDRCTVYGGGRTLHPRADSDRDRGAVRAPRGR